MAESNVELARRGFEAALRIDLDTVAELLDSEVKWHGGDPSVGCQNAAEVLGFMRNSDVIRAGGVELVDVIGAGDRVVVIMRPPSRGDEPAPVVANLATFRDGRVIEIVHYPNPDDALAAARAG